MGGLTHYGRSGLRVDFGSWRMRERRLHGHARGKMLIAVYCWAWCCGFGSNAVMGGLEW